MVGGISIIFFYLTRLEIDVSKEQKLEKLINVEQKAEGPRVPTPGTGTWMVPVPEECEVQSAIYHLIIPSRRLSL